MMKNLNCLNVGIRFDVYGKLEENFKHYKILKLDSKFKYFEGKV